MVRIADASDSRRMVFAGLMVIGMGVAHAADGPSPGGATDARSELDQVLKRLNALDAWLDEAGERIAKGQREVAAADRRVAAAQGRIRELDNRIERGRAELERLGIERQRLEEARRRQAGRVADHLRDAWRFKERDPLQALFNLEEPRKLEKMVRYHAAFAKARTAQVDALRRTLEELERNQREQDRERVSLETSRESVDADRARLIGDRAKRQGLIGNLNAELAKRTEERDRLTGDRNRLESLIAELARASRPARGGLDVAAREGGLDWPVKGRLVRRFGEPRAGGRLRWQGVMFDAPAGSDVRAVAPGVVVFSDWLRGFGMLAIVDHGDGWMSLYGSVDAIYKRRGDQVELDEVIATVGQSGGEVEVGLYFEMRHNEVPKDPLAWLRSDSRQRPAR
ncbi:MAG: peptidoglycan DD-metalloendopeptidase family protein [Gammaproteobacteria bacterium]|nr:peptidoglycan DD-metalloendopeptidase family protein [Gammaproteobacteria bacterium]